MEIFVAVCLIVIGISIGLLGYKLFRVLLPIAGLVVGGIIGFAGIQGMFGTGVTGTTIAILVAVVFALVLAFLSYAFFEIALAVLLALLMSSLFTLLGIALGLSANGFVLGLLSLSGFVVGLIAGTSSKFLTEGFVTFVTAYVGSGLVLAGVFLLISGVDLNSLYADGILATVTNYASHSFWWVLIWIAGIVIMRQVQLQTIMLELFPEHLAFLGDNK